MTTTEKLIAIALEAVKEHLDQMPTDKAASCLVKYYALSLYECFMQFCEDNPDCIAPFMFLGSALVDTLNMAYTTTEALVEDTAEIEYHKVYVLAAYKELTNAFREQTAIFSTARAYEDKN